MQYRGDSMCNFFQCMQRNSEKDRRIWRFEALDTSCMYKKYTRAWTLKKRRNKSVEGCYQPRFQGNDISPSYVAIIYTSHHIY